MIEVFFVWEHTGSNRGPSACKAEGIILSMFIVVLQIVVYQKYLVLILVDGFSFFAILRRFV